MAGKVRDPKAGYLKAVWLEIFGQVFLEISVESDPRDPARSPGPARHINLHEKSAPQATSKAKRRRANIPPDRLQVPRKTVDMISLQLTAQNMN